MLVQSDLDAFIRLVRQAKGLRGPIPDASPDITLSSDGNSEGRLHRTECARLWKSLRVACAAGDVPESFGHILEAIVRDLTAEDQRYLPLSNAAEWLDAIRWGMSQPVSSGSDNLRRLGMDRQFHVGVACRRLRGRGYSIPIHTFGPHVDSDTRIRTASLIDNLVAQVGGVNAVRNLFRLMRESGKLHDGMWLFGNIPGSTQRVSHPAVPLGWLLSIALRNLHKAPSTDSPAKVWQSAVEIATDFAASMDCQRYNPYEGFSIEAHDYLFSLAESLTWRELFTLPQVPPLVLPIVHDAFRRIEWRKRNANLAAEVDGMCAEFGRLVDCLRVDDLTAIPSPHARSAFPLLWQHANAAPGVPNANFLDPFGTHPRDHDRFVFFDAGGGMTHVLPPALATASACEVIFRHVRERAGSKAEAEDIVANTIEESVGIACRRHTPNVWQNREYGNRRERLEIDVAAREGQEIVLFETKAKMLTSGARAGDTLKFVDDYTKSFLSLLLQLVRHERNIRCGRTPLTDPGEDPAALRVTKIAVSPLSFGPASDYSLSNALMNAIAQVQLSIVDGNPERAAILNRFNRKIAACMGHIDKVAPRSNGLVDLGHFMMRVSWLDLGQLLYCLNRGRSVLGAVSALMHLSFGTRDLWSEIAAAERQGLTNRNWHPIHLATMPLE